MPIQKGWQTRLGLNQRPSESNSDVLPTELLVYDSPPFTVQLCPNTYTAGGRPCPEVFRHAPWLIARTERMLTTRESW